MTNNPQQSIDETLAVLYNAAWVEGSNWDDNNTENGPIPSEREVKKIARAKAALKEVVDGIIGETEYANIHEQPSDKWLETTGRNQLRTEQRKRAGEVFSEPQTNNGTHVPAGS